MASKMVNFKVSEEELARTRQAMGVEGFENLSEWIRALIRRHVRLVLDPTVPVVEGPPVIEIHQDAIPLAEQVLGDDSEPETEAEALARLAASPSPDPVKGFHERQGEDAERPDTREPVTYEPDEGEGAEYWDPDPQPPEGRVRCLVCQGMCILSRSGNRLEPGEDQDKAVTCHRCEGTGLEPLDVG